MMDLWAICPGLNLREGRGWKETHDFQKRKLNNFSTKHPCNKKTMNTKPIHEVRLGAIKAAVWKNQTETGVRFNATFTRLYRQNEKWASTDSFGRDDLLVLAKVADQAHSWIHLQEQQESGNKQPPAETAETPPTQY